jgi:hypothetical protein
VPSNEVLVKQTIAIIGAGPYGLSAAAHLRSLPDTRLLVFGSPMSFWEEKMPKGMFLRSGWRASYISDPRHDFSLDAFQSASGGKISTPVPLDRFVAYGRWFQQKAVPDLDTRLVASVTKNGTGFQLRLNDETCLSADRVIVAGGIASFAITPSDFSALPQGLSSHSSEHTDFAMFAGKKVAVVGGGQSALESAALLHEAKAEVEVFVRSEQVHFLGWRKKISHTPFLFKILYSWTDVGPAGLSQLVSRPDLFRLLPHTLQDPLAYRSIRPAGAGWLIPRLEGVVLHKGVTIHSVLPNGSKLRLEFNNGLQKTVDHVLFATGYKVDVSRYPFLPPEIVAGIRQSNGYPILDPSFQSSVKGLHFLGAPAAWSFGPLMRFVAGTEFVSTKLAEELSRRQDS